MDATRNWRQHHCSRAPGVFWPAPDDAEVNARPWTALALLVGLVACRFGWQLVPLEHRADAWNVAQACAILGLLGLLALVYRSSVWVLAVLALGAAWQAMTAVCSVAYIVRPWQVLPNQEQCDAALDAPLSLFGLWLAVMLAALIAQGGRRGARIQ